MQKDISFHPESSSDEQTRMVNIGHQQQAVVKVIEKLDYYEPVRWNDKNGNFHEDFHSEQYQKAINRAKERDDEN